MSDQTTRRTFLRQAAVLPAVWGMGGAAGMVQLPAVSAGEATVRPDIVRLRPDIEPAVALLEDTPRNRLLEEVAHRIRKGLSYQEVVTALQLAGVRNIQPRPSVGFKFHAVLVVNSARLASLAASDQDRWLPIFWALDYFKSSQARDVREGNWTMAPVVERGVPRPSKARQAFVQAMDRWDEEAADAAAAGLARGGAAHEVFELFCHYGCRDFRSIGHKAIFVSNARRTLECMGWRHAEPVLRSLAYALLNHNGEPNPAAGDLAPDRPWRRNQKLADKIRSDWLDGQLDQPATSDLLATLRTGSADEACDQVVELLNQGTAPQSIWDALLDGAGELLMRQPGIVALHAVTSSNALRYAFETCGNDRTRRLILLQNTAFLPLFREAMRGRGKVGDAPVGQLQPIPLTQAGPAAIQEILSDVSHDRNAAAGKVLTYLQSQPAAPLLKAARTVLCHKGDDAHDYKFGSAVMEDYYRVSTAWRARFLATSVFHLHGAGDPDNPLMERIRAAFA